MASNSFGILFRMTTWGESHGKAIGVVIDGCPAGLEIDEEEINRVLAWRAPGRNPYVSPRREEDRVELLSGVFEGKTTGTPLSILIPNRDVDSSQYESIRESLRPGHANYTYLEKYGVFDYRGGGRASARETACRVAAGAVAQKFLRHHGIHTVAYLKQMGEIEVKASWKDLELLRTLTYQSPLFCPDEGATSAMMDLIDQLKEERNSVGGIVEFLAWSLPAGLGDPLYEKLEASLAHAMMGLPAAKGFEIGSGFRSALMHGSEYNDPFIFEHGAIRTKTNHAGGILGGISTGMPLVGRVVFKPTSSLGRVQESVTLSGEPASLAFSAQARHDPCVAVRAVPVVEAMMALVLADALLLKGCARL